MLRALAVLAVIVAACDQPSIDPDRDDREPRGPGLVLQERASWPVPVPEAVAGASIGDGGQVVVWTDDGNLQLYHPRSAEGESVAGAPPNAVGVGGGQGSSWAGLIAASRTDGSFVRVFGADSVVVLSTRCGALNQASGALATDSGLWLIETDPDSGAERLALYRILENNCDLTDVVRLDCPLGRTSITPGRRAGGVVVACSQPDRPLVAISHSEVGIERRELEGSAPSWTDSPDPTEQEPLWFGLPILRTGDGFLRVVADLRSDLRRFERWNEAGRHRSTTVIRGPLGLLASDPVNGLVLGMRAGPDGHRLVLFEVEDGGEPEG